MKTSARNLAPLLLVAFAALDPARAAEETASLWFTSNIRVPISERFSWNLIVQPRFDDDISQLDRVLVRSWFDASLPYGLAVGLGYDAHVIENPVPLLEQRAWQQLAFKRKWPAVRTFGYARIEQRFFEDSDGVAVRGRVLLGLAVPLMRSVDLVARNEFFVNFNETDAGVRTGYRENRLFGGLSRPLNQRTRAEVGYQMLWVNLPGPDAIAHTLMLGIAFETPSLQTLW